MIMMMLAHRYHCVLGHRLAGLSKGLITSSSSALPTDYLCRHLHNTKCNDDGSVTKIDKTRSSNVTLCQINNHPDYRLRVAKERLAVKTANKQVTATTNQRANFSSKSRGTPSPNNFKNNKVRESGLRIDIMENPVRSNDGTSSGAIINDRLRLARRKAIEKMKAPIVDNIEEATITSERPLASGDGENNKIEQEKFWMEMWKDAGNEIKRLRKELKEETDEAAIADMQADIKGLRKRKLEFAKLLGMDE